MFSVEDLRALVPERSDKSFSEGLRRLVRQGVLERPLGAPKGLSRNDRSNRSTIREPLACPRVTSVCTVSCAVSVQTWPVRQKGQWRTCRDPGKDRASTVIGARTALSEFSNRRH